MSRPRSPKPRLDHTILRWLIPGLSVKRWIALMIAGMALIGLGISYLLVEFYREAPLPYQFYYLTLQFLPRAVRALLVGGLGLGGLVIGLYKFNRSLISSVHDGATPILDKLWQQRIASHGPQVVAIGGGHGLAALLSGLKHHTTNITAIVTVADDGGSSGRLRRELGVLPPGDFRMCIAALADDESMVTQLFQYRFGSNGTGSSLAGHSFGNLFIAALAELTGSFEKALIESSRVVASQGRIIPSTLNDVTLCAEFQANSELAIASGGPAKPVHAKGESSIGQVGLPIERVWLEPNDVPAYPETVRAILDADAVIMGPGSLFTSVMPNLLVPGVAEALRNTKAKRIYICNVATERGETDRYGLAEHVAAIERHIGRNVIDLVIANTQVSGDFDLPKGVQLVKPAGGLGASNAQLLIEDVADDETPWRHDSAKLAAVVARLISER
jgi:uncharacterized cofD-like protein